MPLSLLRCPRNPAATPETIPFLALSLSKICCSACSLCRAVVRFRDAAKGSEDCLPLLGSHAALLPFRAASRERSLAAGYSDRRVLWGTMRYRLTPEMTSPDISFLPRSSIVSGKTDASSLAPHNADISEQQGRTHITRVSRTVNCSEHCSGRRTPGARRIAHL